MASYPTQPAFIYDFPTGDFDATTRSHPVLKFLEDHIRNIVEGERWGNAATEEIHSTAFWKTGHGHTSDNADDHYALARKLHSRFHDYYHAYDHIIVYEVEDGWYSLGTARFWYNTNHGVKTGKVRKHKDPRGQEWEGVSPGAYRLHYGKGKDGEVVLKGVELYNAMLQHDE